MTSNEYDPGGSERQAHAEATYERLFGPRDNTAPDYDHELMEILRRSSSATCSTLVSLTTRPAN